MYKLQNEHEASKLQRRNYLKYIGVHAWKIRSLSQQQSLICPKLFEPMKVFYLQHNSGLLGVWVAISELNCLELKDLTTKILKALKCPVVDQMELYNESGVADVIAKTKRHLIMFDGELELSAREGLVYKIPSPWSLSKNHNAKAMAWKVMQKFVV
jgi:hypothetical protein